MTSFAGFGLKCYQCISTKSWDDCADVKVVNYCAFGQERCFYAVSSHKKKGTSIEVFHKGCLTAAQCEHGYLESFCKMQKGFGCTGYCCSDDLCNGGALPMLKNTGIGTNNRAIWSNVSRHRTFDVCHGSLCTISLVKLFSI